MELVKFIMHSNITDIDEDTIAEINITDDLQTVEDKLSNAGIMFSLMSYESQGYDEENHKESDSKDLYYAVALNVKYRTDEGTNIIKFIFGGSHSEVIGIDYSSYSNDDMNMEVVLIDDSGTEITRNYNENNLCDIAKERFRLIDEEEDEEDVPVNRGYFESVAGDFVYAYPEACEPYVCLSLIRTDLANKIAYLYGNVNILTCKLSENHEGDYEVKVAY